MDIQIRREKNRAKAKAHYDRHKDEPGWLEARRAKQSMWREENKEKLSAYYKERYLRIREVSLARCRAWRESHPDYLVRARQSRQKNHLKNKSLVFAAYGCICSCCGEREPAFLTLEHVSGGGRDHKRKVHGVCGVYRDVVRRGFPGDFTLLCMNCNWARRDGPCPHVGKPAVSLII